MSSSLNHVATRTAQPSRLPRAPPSSASSVQKIFDHTDYASGFCEFGGEEEKRQQASTIIRQHNRSVVRGQPTSVRQTDLVPTRHQHQYSRQNQYSRENQFSLVPRQEENRPRIKPRPNLLVTNEPDRRSQRTQLMLRKERDGEIEKYKGEREIEEPMPKLVASLKEEYTLLKEEKRKKMIEQSTLSKKIAQEKKGSLVFHDFKWQNVSSNSPFGDDVQMSKTESGPIIKRERFPLGKLSRNSPKELVALLNSPKAQQCKGHKTLWSDVEREVLRCGASLSVSDVADIAFAVGRADAVRAGFVARLGQWVARGAEASIRHSYIKENAKGAGKGVNLNIQNIQNRSVNNKSNNKSGGVRSGGLRLSDLSKILYAIAKAPDFRDSQLIAKLCNLCAEADDLRSTHIPHEDSEFVNDDENNGKIGVDDYDYNSNSTAAPPSVVRFSGSSSTNSPTFFRDISLITDALGRLEGEEQRLSRYFSMLEKAAKIENARNIEGKQEGKIMDENITGDDLGIFSLTRWCAQVAHVMRMELEGEEDLQQLLLSSMNTETTKWGRSRVNRDVQMAGGGIRSGKNMFVFPEIDSINVDKGGMLDERHVARVLKGFVTIIKEICNIFFQGNAPANNYVEHHLDEVSRFLAFLLPNTLKQCEGSGRVLLSPKDPRSNVLQVETLLTMTEVFCKLVRLRTTKMVGESDSDVKNNSDAVVDDYLVQVFSKEAPRCLAALSQTLKDFQSLSDLARIADVTEETRKLAARNIRSKNNQSKDNQREKIASAIDRCNISVLRKAMGILRLREIDVGRERCTVLYGMEEEEEVDGGNFECAADLGDYIQPIRSVEHQGENNANLELVSRSLELLPPLPSVDEKEERDANDALVSCTDGIRSSHDTPRLLDLEFSALLKLLPLLLDPSIRSSAGNLQKPILDILINELQARTRGAKNGDHVISVDLVRSCREILGVSSVASIPGIKNVLQEFVDVGANAGNGENGDSNEVQVQFEDQQSIVKNEISSLLELFGGSGRELQVQVSDSIVEYFINADRLSLPVWKAVEFVNALRKEMLQEKQENDGQGKQEKQKQNAVILLHAVVENLVHRCCSEVHGQERFQCVSADSARDFAGAVRKLGFLDGGNKTDEQLIHVEKLVEIAEQFAMFHKSRNSS